MQCFRKSLCSRPTLNLVGDVDDVHRVGGRSLHAEGQQFADEPDSRDARTGFFMFGFGSVLKNRRFGFLCRSVVKYKNV